MVLLRHTLFLLIFPQLVFAASINQYVDTSCGNNGDGTTNSCAGSPGGAGAYNDCTSWESQNTDLVSAGDELTVDFNNQDCNEILTIAGWTTGASNRLILKNLNIAINLYNPTLVIDDDYVTVQDASIEKTGEFPEGDVRAVRLDANTNFILERSTIRAVSLTPDNSGGLVDINSNGGSVDGTIIRNNIIYDCPDYCLRVLFDDGDTVSVENNTFVDGTDNNVNISAWNSGSGSTINFYNNISTGSSASDYSISTGSATYNNDDNISSDTTSPNAAHRSVTITYADAGANDFHLDSGETDAIDAGTTRGGFSDDIDGDTRSGSWDIGADETTGGGGGGASPILFLGDY